MAQARARRAKKTNEPLLGDREFELGTTFSVSGRLSDRKIFDGLPDLLRKRFPRRFQGKKISRGRAAALALRYLERAIRSGALSEEDL